MTAALAGKVAWVTGGGTGIGRAGARALAEAGCKVVISGRSADTRDETASLVRKAGGCHATLPGMRKRRDGVVINISSWLGKFITPLAGPSYAASKFGAAALTETINAEDGLNGVRACVICPAEVATPILRKRPIVPPQEEQNRMLQEEDLGRTIAFVAAMPARACINEIIISPTYNRFYFGGREIDQVKK